MAQIVYSSRALTGLERLTDFLQAESPIAAAQTVTLIAEAVEILNNHPLMGRPVEEGLREIVISRGKSGYLALYSYEHDRDTVLVLAVRHQLEVGYLWE